MEKISSRNDELAAYAKDPKIILEPIKFVRIKNNRVTLRLYIASVKSAIRDSKRILGIDPTATNGFNLVFDDKSRRSFQTSSSCFLKQRYILRAVFTWPGWYYNDIFSTR